MNNTDWLDEVIEELCPDNPFWLGQDKLKLEAKQAILNHINKAINTLEVDTRPLLYPDGIKYADEVYIKGLAELRKELGLKEDV